MKTTAPLTPLTPAVLYILLALATGEKHGYAIMKQVNSDSGGHVKMGSGTLYGSIKRMLADELIEEAGDKIDATIDDERRRYYQLTALGRQVLNSEMQRYSDVITIARNRNLISNAPIRPL